MVGLKGLGVASLNGSKVETRNASISLSLKAVPFGGCTIFTPRLPYILGVPDFKITLKHRGHFSPTVGEWIVLIHRRKRIRSG